MQDWGPRSGSSAGAEGTCELKPLHLPVAASSACPPPPCTHALRVLLLLRAGPEPPPHPPSLVCVLGFSKPCPWAEGRPPAGSVLCLSFAGSAARALPSLPPLGPRPGRCSESRILDAGHPSLSLTEWRDGVKKASDRIYFLCKNVDRKAMCIFLCAVARLWK